MNHMQIRNEKKELRARNIIRPWGKKKYQKRGNKGKNIGVFLSLFLFILFASFKSIIFKKAKITILRQIYHEYKSKILSNLVINKGINKMIKLAPKFFEKLIYKDNLTRK